MHHRVADHTKTWGLPVLFLITHIFRKKGIKGNATYGPITESLCFDRIQWNQSCSHIPRATTAPQPQPQPKPKPEFDPEPMDIHEMATEQKKAAKLERAAEHDEQPEEEYEETITFRAAYFYALQDTLEDIRFQIADIQRDARQDRLETQDMLQAILDKLPPAP